MIKVSQRCCENYKTGKADDWSWVSSDLLICGPNNSVSFSLGK